MLDMYSQSSFSQVIYKSGQSPLEVCQFYDGDYKFVRRTFIDMINFPHRPPPFPEIEVIGGPRIRIFYPSQNTDKVFPRVLPRVMGQILKRMVKLGIYPKDKVPHMAPMLFKIPLVKWRQGLCYYASTHIMTPIKLSKVTSVLLHFKFFSTFYENAIAAVESGAYQGGGVQYRRYIQGIESNKIFQGQFYYEGSVKYLDSESLVINGLIKSVCELKNIVNNSH